MAVVANPVDASLRLRFQTGSDAAGNPVYRLQSYSRISPEAADQNLYDVAQALAGLQQHQLSAVLHTVQRELVAV